MVTTIELVKKTDLEELIESGNEKAIIEMTKLKEAALKDALEGAEFYRSINNAEFADNEQSRANLLTRQLSKLRTAL